MHERGDDVSGLLGIGVGVVVDAGGVALYPCHGVADDGLEKNAIGRPFVGVHHL